MDDCHRASTRSDVIGRRREARGEVGVVERAAVLDTLVEHRGRGDLRFIGFSGKTVEGHLRAIESGVVDCLMVEYHSLDERQAAVIDASKESTANTTPTDTISSDSIINKDTMKDDGAPILRSTSISRRRSRMDASSMAFRPSKDDTKINIEMPSSMASTLPTNSHS